MTLTQVHFTPVLKNDDPEFNHEYAQKIVELISKMDRDEMEIFTMMVVDEVLFDTIEKNQRTLQRHVTETALACIEDIKKSMKTTVLSKGLNAEDTPYINAIYELEEIIKGPSPYDYGYVFQETDFRRDPGGRFTKKIQIDPTKPPVPFLQRGPLGIPEPQRPFNQAREADRDADKARYHQEYLQVRDFLNSVAEGSPDTAEAYLHLKDKNGIRYIKRINAMPDGDTWNSNVEEVEAISARPKDLNIGGAAFGLSSALGRGPMATANRVEQNMGAFAGKWDEARQKPSSNERLYGRTAAAGKFLTDVAPFGSSLQIAGAFGQFVGSHGPDAEKVLGPGIRRAAYRYRGTEKTPDDAMVEDYQRTIRGTSQRMELTPEEERTIKIRQNRALTRALDEKWKQANAGATGDPSRITRLGVNQERVKDLQDVERTRALVPIQNVKLTKEQRAQVMNQVRTGFMAQRAAQTTPTGAAADLGRDVISRHLALNAPNPKLFALQLDSGNTPPSEGVIIDKNGKIVAQAVGYGDDHYLPFNLKNMKRLQGGEYIRTRSVGGPTSEDIYTGLMMGAKRIQVNSRSGTFIVEFEDDFTGRRRYNDKAKRMVRRYEQILDSVQSEQVDRQGVRPEIRATFEEEINEKFPGMKRLDKRKLLEQRIEEYKRDPEMDETDIAAFERRMDGITRGMGEDEAKRTRNDAWNSWREDKEFKYRLNGIGYAAALKALEEQFPYYLKTYDRPVSDQPERASFERDQGYVQPGRNRPAMAGAGLHGARHSYQAPEGSRGKFRADNADYQGGGKPAPEAPAANGEKAKNGEKEETPEQQLKGKFQAIKLNQNYAQVAAKIATKIRGASDNWERDRGMAIYSWLDRDEPDLVNFLATPEGANKLNLTLRQMGPALKANGVVTLQDEIELRNAAGQLDRKAADSSLLYVIGKPQIYGEAPYQAGADQNLINDEVTRLGQAYAVGTGGRRLGELSAAELNHELEVLARFNPVIDLLNSVTRDAAYTELASQGVAMANTGVLDTMLDKDQMDAHAEAVQRLRSLALYRAEQPKTTVTETKTIGSAPQDAATTIKLNREELEDIVGVFEDAHIKAIKGSQSKIARDFAEAREVLTSYLNQDVVTDKDLVALGDNPIFKHQYNKARKYLGQTLDDRFGEIE